MASRLRVLLLFGGRSAEHDVARHRGRRRARARSRPLRGRARRDHHRRPLAAGRRRARRDRSRARRAPGGVRVAGTPEASAIWLPIPATAARSTSTSCSRCCTAPTARTAPCRASSSSPACRTSAPGVVGSGGRHGQGDDEARVRRMRPRQRTLARVPRRSRPRRVRRAGRGRARLPVLRQAGQPGFVGRRVEGERPRRVRRACELALRFDEWIVVEEAIAGREIEVAVLGDDPPEASVPGEIVPGDEFYSYADKYESDDAELLVPAPLTADRRPARASRVGRSRRAGARRWRASTCSSRSAAPHGVPRQRGEHDSRASRPISMYPRLWEASGVPYAELLDRLIELAIARHARRARAPARQR